jgi:microcystin-dependent protein
MEGVIGYTTLFAGNFAPKNWAFCQGQILAIASNTALFSILGTVYGGNGTTTFGLPDLRGRSVVGAGSGPGLSPYVLGEQVGTETSTITTSQMPAHVHPVQVVITPAAASSASVPNPVGGVYATQTELLYNPSADSSFKPYNASLTMQPAGSGQAFSTLPPVLGLNYVICMFGVYPARN